ncbi:hypothetical protein GCM10010873_05910 [Cypionkella aquatica]|uniref:HTH LytTR-type domain-containing protein n=1 Tax=Cypionkella aquatica TaxID=1756042 RepID=A0AA37TR01_9RHOB|nr:LytTR family DNA-binding domain-containing protein [Cypionkella aquatica]GLS85618.1 hypothetical protein GCM10010873_05910 [Cypionkella aquatica]
MLGFFAQFKNEFRSRVSLTVWALLTCFLAVTGPFGTAQAFGFLTRLGFWAMVMGSTIIVGSSVRAIVKITLGHKSERVRALAIAALLSIVMAPLLQLVALPVHFYVGTAIPELGELMILVATVSLGVSSLRQAVVQQEQSAPAKADAAPQTPALPRLLARIEPEMRGSLIAISVRDHYVDVLTSAGTISLLMRFSDAMAETAPVDGDQIHRSHWVAWHAVQGIERDGIKLFVILPGEMRLPVSKNHRDKLLARGLL